MKDLLKITLLSLMLIASGQLVLAQGIAGKWQGTLEEQLKKSSTKYQFEMELEEFGESVKGTTRISTVTKPGEPYKYAQMEITGTFRDKVFTFKEIKVISQEGMESLPDWCLKFGNLDFMLVQEEGQLVGRYEAKNGKGSCAPGTINVIRVQ
jgi:hypothetical protein